MKPDWCPQWAWDEAENIGRSIYGRHERGFVMWPLVTRTGVDPREPVARALLESHQRGRREGMEEAAKVAHCHSDDRPLRYGMDWNDGYMDGCRGAEDAIRAKMEEQP